MEMMAQDTAIIIVKVATSALARQRRKQVNKEYYQAKADLCRNLAIKQMVEGEAKEAGANLIRMVNALNQINLINYKEEKDNAEHTSNL
jgi:hypothetical protein